MRTAARRTRTTSWFRLVAFSGASGAVAVVVVCWMPGAARARTLAGADLVAHVHAQAAESGGRRDHLLPRRVAARAVPTLANVGFEEGAYAPTNAPTGWAREAFVIASAGLTWDDSVSHGGGKSVRIDLATPNDARWIQTVPVSPATRYRFCGWIKTQSVANSAQAADAGANLSVMGAFEYRGIRGTNDWTRECLTFDSGERTEVTLAVRIGMYGGTTTGTAWFDDLSLEVVPVAPPRIRVAYLVPSDRSYRADYHSVIEQAIRNLQSWYHAELGGSTFRLNDPVVEVFASGHDSGWFQGGGGFGDLFNLAAGEVWALAGEGGFDDPQSRWVVYVDVRPAAGQCGGCGTSGVAVLARGDIQGLAGEPRVELEFTEYASVCRYVGGLGHELGHALGLPHPAECDQGLPACFAGSSPPADSLMWTGYAIYPRTYFLPAQASALLATQFLASGLSVDPLVDCTLITACPAGGASCSGVCGPAQTTAPPYNPSFEDCLYNPDGKPQAWERQVFQPTTAVLTWDQVEVLDGLRSVRIENTAPNDSSWTQTVPVLPQRTYRFCGWVKTEGVVNQDGNAGANLSILDAFTHVGISGTNDWSELCLEFESGAVDEVRLAARLGMNGGLVSGTAWFDALRLELLSPTPSPTGTSTRTATATRTRTPSRTRTATRTSTPGATRTRTGTGTATPSASPSAASATTTQTPTPTSSATPVPSVVQNCPGDCDGDARVTADDLARAVSIVNLCPCESGLGGRATGCPASLGGCTSSDRDGDGCVSASELTRLVLEITQGPRQCSPSGPDSPR